jgi:hypothetical protein
MVERCEVTQDDLRSGGTGTKSGTKFAPSRDAGISTGPWRRVVGAPSSKCREGGVTDQGGCRGVGLRPAQLAQVRLTACLR